MRIEDFFSCLFEILVLTLKRKGCSSCYKPNYFFFLFFGLHGIYHMSSEIGSWTKTLFCVFISTF